MAHPGSDPNENRRIDSWKEIAAFFGRDERTVKRWEKERALPIHRMPGGKGGVFAYSAELKAWLHSAPQPKVTLDAHDSNVTELPTVPETDAENQLPHDDLVTVTTPSGVDHEPPIVRGNRMRWLVVSVALIGVAAIGVRVFDHGAHGRMLLTRHRPEPSAEAQEFYLKGRYYWNRRTGDSLDEALDAFRQAIDREPSYAEAYAGMAECYDLMREYGPMPPSESYPKAIAAANKAIELDDSLADAHSALAFALFYWNWDVRRAMEEFQRAIELNPNDVETHHWFATSLLTLHRLPEALTQIEIARNLNPTSPSVLADRALIIYWSGESNRGLAELEELRRAEPDFLSPHRYLAEIFRAMNDDEGFITESKRSGALSKDAQEMDVADAAATGWERNGERGMLEAMYKTQKKYFDDGQASGFALARTCSQMSRKKEAVHYLHAAFAAHDAMLLNLFGSQMEKELKGEPEFSQLEDQIRQKIAA